MILKSADLYNIIIVLTDITLYLSFLTALGQELLYLVQLQFLLVVLNTGVCKTTDETSIFISLSTLKKHDLSRLLL